MIARIRFYVVCFLASAAMLFFVPAQIVALWVAKLGWKRPSEVIPVLAHRSLLRIFNFRLTLQGEISKDRPLLLVVNHVSWLDIIVLGAVGPLCFVAKSEMLGWPIFGHVAKLQRTVFIKRENRRNSADQAREIALRMAAREVMVLFPEGTTTDGNHLAAFKTALFEAAKIALARSPVDTAQVQPAAIEYTHLHGLRLGRAERPHVAWPGEIGLGESFVPLIRAGALDVTIHFGNPITLDDKSHRKMIARDAADSIRSMLDSSRQAG